MAWPAQQLAGRRQRQNAKNEKSAGAAPENGGGISENIWQWRGSESGKKSGVNNGSGGSSWHRRK